MRLTSATGLDNRCETDICSAGRRRFLLWMYGCGHWKRRQSRGAIHDVRPVQIVAQGQRCTSIQGDHRYPPTPFWKSVVLWEITHSLRLPEWLLEIRRIACET